MNLYIITETSKARVCFVNVPEDATEFDTGNQNGLFFFYDTKPVGTATRFQLPPGEWQLLPRLSQVSEEQAAGIVDDGEGPVKGWFKYYDANKGKGYTILETNNPLSALISLARSLNIPEDQDPVVLVEFKK